MRVFCSLVLLFLSLSMSLSTEAQLRDIVATEGISTDLHKHNIGKLFFMDKPVPVSVLKETDFLKSYSLTNKSDLFFVAFLENSLTNHLHRLAPGIPADSLVRVGNYQFALFVDGKEIYKSNLLPGAPRPQTQNFETTINRPLIDNKNGAGSWSESFWNRFLLNGGDSVLTDGRHSLRMEIRPYIKSDSVITGTPMAAGELEIRVSRNPKIDISSIKLNPPAPYDGFAVSTETFDQNRIRKLKGSIDEGIFKKVSSVIVIKNGRLLIEEYFNGSSRTTLQDTRSVGKSFSSTLTGMAIRDHYIRNEEQTIGDFYDLRHYANYTPAKETISLRELLTMSSSFDGNDEDGRSPGNEENMYPAPDWVKFALDLPVTQKKASGEWQYFTAGVVLLGDILNKKVKGGLEKFAHEKLFKPLHITHYQWQYTPQNVPNTAGGLQMNALDLAKYGQLYKNGGVWNKKQILPKDWVNKTFTRQEQIAGRINEFYGYLFWNKTFPAMDKSYEAFYCAGNGGNYILIFKDLPLVIVITATAYGQPYAHSQVAKMISEYILPAVIH